VNQPSDRFESDADRAAAAATSGQPAQVAARGAPPAVQRQEREAGFVEQQLRNLLDRALQEGISYDSEKGLKVGGVAVSDVERGVEVFDRILDGDFQGALQVINPRDPREEERRREEFRRLREELERFRDQLRPPEEKRREQREMERRRSEALRQMAERLGITGRTRFRLREPTLDLRTVGLHPGTTTHWIFDRFRLESAALQPHHRQRLNDLANQVKSNPNAELEILGHADTSGPLAFNQGLSERRAGAVRDYLVGRGVQADKIKSVTGRGEEEPRIPERTETDRALNRRVDVFFWTGVSQRRKSPFGLPPLRLRD
jgi:outer membrane protein OmpA-like peptidoglycan-associated protein